MSQEFDPDIKGMSPDAEQFVRSAMPTLGWAQRTTGHWTHGLGVKNPRHDGEEHNTNIVQLIEKHRKNCECCPVSQLIFR